MLKHHYASSLTVKSEVGHRCPRVCKQLSQQMHMGFPASDKSRDLALWFLTGKHSHYHLPLCMPVGKHNLNDIKAIRRSVIRSHCYCGNTVFRLDGCSTAEDTLLRRTLWHSSNHTRSPAPQLDGQTPNRRHTDACDDMQEKNKNANYKRLILMLFRSRFISFLL